MTTGNYSVRDHASMLADEARVSAYARAMESVIVPGCTVLDIGTGCGIFALYACELGAARVYAVEAENLYFLAREVVAQSPHASKIQLAHGMSTELSLPEQVDVVISDLHGVLPVFAAHLTSIVDARTRHLKEGGTLIPRKDSLWVAAVSSEKLDSPYSLLRSEPLGIDLRAALPYATSSWVSRRGAELELLSAPEKWADIDFATMQGPNVRGTASLIANTDGMAHGLSVWFDCLTAEGVELSNHPSRPTNVYGSAFFPFAEPVALARGDRLDVVLGASLVDGEYIWRWETHIAAPSGKKKARFRQDSFHAEPADAQRVRTHAGSYIPQRIESIEVEQFILERFDGKRTNEAIAQALLAQFPSSFPSPHAALSRVTAAAGRHRVQGTRLESIPQRHIDRK